MNKLADAEHIAAQYKDATRFEARVRIYKLYATNPQPWLGWLFDCLQLGAEEVVLELGAGTGNIWLENLERIPEQAQIMLSDFSSGIRYALSHLQSGGGDIRNAPAWMIPVTLLLLMALLVWRAPMVMHPENPARTSYPVMRRPYRAVVELQQPGQRRQQQVTTHFYGGDASFTTGDGSLISWRQLDRIGA